jgi:WD40 repeat protein
MVPRGDVDAHAKTCRYEQSRWIVEPLKKEIEEIKNKLEEECTNRKKDVEEITRQLQLILTIQKSNTFQKHESIGTYEKIILGNEPVPMHSPTDETSTSSNEQDDSKIAYLASGSRYSGDIKIWDINGEKVLEVLKGHTRAVLSLIVLADGTLVSASEDKTIRFWNVETSTCTKVLSEHVGEVTCVIELTNGELASCSWDESIRIWKENGNTQIIKTGRRMECVLQYNKDTLVCSSWDYEISFWNITNGQKIKSLKGHTRPVCSLIKLKDGKIVSGSWDKTIRVWKDDTCVQTLEGHTNWVTTLLELADGRLASGSSDNTVRVWNIDSGDYSTLSTENQSIHALAQTKETLLIGTCGLKVWKNGQCVKTLDKHNEVRSIVIKYNN